MRLGVLDVGSNTVHLLVVDAYRGAQPTPQLSQKSELRLAESIGAKGGLSRHAADALVEAVADAKHDAKKLGCDELMAFATSAVRDARNAAEVLGRVVKETGVELSVLSGDDEARLTFLAVRRWLGWSAGNLMSLDIGGGSLELAAGCDEEPAVAVSLPLGAARLTRDWFDDDPPDKQSVAALRAHVAALLDKPARALLDTGAPDRVVATSKTFRTLARLAGAAPSSEGPRARRLLTRTGLVQVTAFISRIPSRDLAELDGVSIGRAHQTLAGAVVAAEAMDALGVAELELCPWAMREGVILRRLDQLTVR
ncbi:MAG: exopolyphosphatase / guanosine-5-triphosphate,3-diphosphate pyrophosphatase [Pseudonocardiales bacterium]|nr:exopolyphosphatase / guanosine-5-triphosphate,3-diphosphate pyrophosphatase [Pseudonocardiales bacterium]